MSVRFVIGNWKMNTTPKECRPFINELEATNTLQRALDTNVRIVICPPFTSLSAASPLPLGMCLGAQDCHEKISGAFTGNVSAAMLVELGCEYVLVGHSERRQYQFETNSVVAQKAQAALAHGITPVICIGETLNQRETQQTFNVLAEQLQALFEVLTPEQLVSCIIAYEPVWAIGTGVSATASQAEEVHKFISEQIEQTCSVNVPILYGGSVTNTNAAELFAQPNISGALVGGASLKADIFAQIIDAAAESNRL